MLAEVGAWGVNLHDNDLVPIDSSPAERDRPFVERMAEGVAIAAQSIDSGAASAKLDFLCKLQAISEFKQVTWRLPPVLVGTFGEEIGMHGAIKLLRKKLVAYRNILAQYDDKYYIKKNKKVIKVI